MHIIVSILGIILWVAAVLYALGWGFIIRRKAKYEQATEGTFEIHAFLLAISVISIPVLSLSPFHLLWMLPASFVLGLASMTPPLFLLSPLWGIPASLYASFWYIGIRNPGRASYLAGDYATAIESFKETIRQHPNSAEARFNLALAYGKIGDTEKAIQRYKEAIRLDPGSAVSHCNLGFDYKKGKYYKEAIESFKEAIRIRPNYGRAIWQLGMLYVDLGRIDDALEQYEVLRKFEEAAAEELYAAINAKTK